MQDIIPPPKAPTQTPKTQSTTSSGPASNTKDDEAARLLIQKKIAEKKAASVDNPQSEAAKAVGGVVKAPLWRRLITGLCVWLCLFTSAGFVISMWANNSLLQTNAFVETFAPLADNAKVQERITSTVTNKILDAAPPQEIAAKLLPAAAVGQTDEQLRNALTPVIKESVASAVKSPQFAVAWRNALSTMHSTLISGIETSSKSIVVNVAPILNQVLDSFTGTKLGFIADEQRQRILDTQNANLTIDDTKGLQKIGTGVTIIKQSKTALPIAAAVFFIIAIALSPYRFRSLRKIIFILSIELIALGALVLTGKKLATTFAPIDIRSFAEVAISRLFSGLIMQSFMIGGILFSLWVILYLLHRTRFSQVS